MADIIWAITCIILAGTPLALIAEYVWRKDKGYPLPTQYFILVLLTWWILIIVAVIKWIRKRNHDKI